MNQPDIEQYQRYYCEHKFVRTECPICLEQRLAQAEKVVEAAKANLDHISEGRIGFAYEVLNAALVEYEEGK